GPTAYPSVDADQSVLFGHSLFAGVNNVIGRPVILIPRDTADEVTINPSATTTVTTPALAGAKLVIPAFAALLNNAPYSGPLGLAEVPLDATPVPLPAGLYPDLAVMIQPGQIYLNPGAGVSQLTLPNRAGWPAGTGMDLWALDPFDGNFSIL